MSDRLRALLLAVVLGGCGGDSSTRVVVVVDNSIDGEQGDPNLVVVIRHDDDDDDDDVAPAPRARLQAAVEPDPHERQDSRNAVEPDLAYVALDAGDRPRSVALAGAGGETLAELALPAEAGVSGLCWSRDRRSVYLGDPDGLRAWRGGAEAEWLVDLPGATPLDAGPLLEAAIDGGILGFEVVLARAPAAGGAEDLFAIFVGASGALLGVQNLTGTPESAEIDAAWLADGSRIALLERSGRDAIAVREISIEVERTGTPRASLAATGTTLWAGEAGTLADLSAARSGDLLALAAWTGSDWDVLCVEPRGVAVNLGSSALDELSPSWSPDGRSLAVEQRCAGDACAARPILVWELGQDEPLRCPEVRSAREIGGPGAWPAWRP